MNWHSHNDNKPFGIIETCIVAMVAICIAVTVAAGVAAAFKIIVGW